MKHKMRAQAKTAAQLRSECVPNKDKPAMEEQLAAYDALPADVRRALARGNHMVNVLAVHDAWEVFGSSYAIRKVREWQRELDYANPVIIRVSPPESASSVAAKYMRVGRRRG